MAAGLDFRHLVLEQHSHLLDKAVGLRVVLYGSLSATGKGHGTDRAVAAGLLGWTPETVDAEKFSNLLRGDEPNALVDLSGRKLVLTPENIEYGPVVHDYPHSNTLTLHLVGTGGPLVSQTYYSVGGGFIQWDGYQPPQRGNPPYPYQNMTELLNLLTETNLNLAEIMLANETTVFGSSKQDIFSGLDKIIQVMDASVTRGLETQGVLPGPIGLARKAPGLYARASGQSSRTNKMLLELNAYALAASEENAAGGIVATAPTLGSAGVIPAVLRHLKTKHRLSAKNCATAC